MSRFFIVILNVMMLNVFVLSVVELSVVVPIQNLQLKPGAYHSGAL